MRFSKISVLVPTRNRLEQLRVMEQSFRETVTDNSAEMIFRVDEDDLTARWVLRFAIYGVVMGPRYEGYRSLPIYFADMLKVMTGDVILCGNDDMVFRTKGWPQLVLAEANKYPDGIFNIGVETFNASHFPWSIISKHAAVTMGGIHHPDLIWGDLYLRDIMAAFGRAIRLNTVTIDHNWMGHTPDQVFLDGRQSDRRNWDKAYWARHRAYVQAAVAKLDADHRMGPAA